MTNNMIAEKNIRERILLDKNWQFNLAMNSDANIRYSFIKTGDAFSDCEDTDFDSSTWRNVDLPHDWAVELPFDCNADQCHGFKAINTNIQMDNSIGWYRKCIDIPENDLGKKISIEFEGVFRDSIVWVNGHYMGRHTSGYTSFYYDISDYIIFGSKNTIIVRVDASQFEGWWYEGAGIYRHVWLLKTAPLHLSYNGTYITSNVDTENENAKIIVNNSISNEDNICRRFSIKTNLLDDKNSIVASGHLDGLKIEEWQEHEFIQIINIDKPKLWSVEKPYIYKAAIEILCDGEIVDRTSIQFGIRTIRFDTENGFFLNGENLKIKGVCCHQDHAGVGVALPDRLNWYRIEKLKEMGCNALRTSHNPPSVELLNACDKLGMLVMDEQRLFGSSKEALGQLESIVLRDRNHPCIILWSIGNEETIQKTKIAESIAKSMKRVLRRLDPSRQITYAANNGDVYEGVNSVVDIRGWNYIGIRQEYAKIDEYHRNHPEQPIIGSEEASAVSTRGVYTTDKEKGYVSVYDNVAPWGSTPDEWWNFYMERKFICGGFAWTGFDYKGEPTPFTWPCINSHYGIMDMCGFPKDSYFYYKAWWSKETVLHIFPHWNFKGREGEIINVRCYSNCEEVELYLNGASLGCKKMTQNSFLCWSVAYAPGRLEAVGLKSGKEVARMTLDTPEKAFSISMEADRDTILADGKDSAIITVSLLDKMGNQITDANNEITFKVNNNAKIIGVGNGDPSSHEPDQYYYDYSKRELSEWKMKIHNEPIEDKSGISGYYDDTDSISITLPSYINPTTLSRNSMSEKYVKSISPALENKCLWSFWPAKNSLERYETYSTVLHICKDDINNGWNKMILKFVSGTACIYVNGIYACEEKCSWFSKIIDISANLREGSNSISIIIKNDKEQNSLRGAWLAAPVEPLWRRKLFNGLCSIILQSKETPGDIMLTASGKDLLPYTLILLSTDTATYD